MDQLLLIHERLRRPAAVLALVALTAVASGCSDAPTPRIPSDPSAADEVALASTPLIDELVLGQVSRDQHEYVGASTAACMEKAGLPYHPTPFFDADQLDEERWNKRDFRAEYGFGITTAADLPDIEAERPADPNDDHTARMRPDDFIAWSNQRIDCEAAAEASAEKQLKAWRKSVPKALRARSREVVTLNAPELDAPVEAWTSCMAANNHDVISPFHVQQSIQEDLEALLPAPPDASLRELQQREIDLALLDLECSAPATRTLQTLLLDLEQELAKTGSAWQSNDNQKQL